MKKTYLNELLANQIIDEEDSKIHGKQKIYFPLSDAIPIIESYNEPKCDVVESSNLTKFDHSITENLTHEPTPEKMMAVGGFALAKYVKDNKIKIYQMFMWQIQMWI